MHDIWTSQPHIPQFEKIKFLHEDELLFTNETTYSHITVDKYWENTKKNTNVKKMCCFDSKFNKNRRNGQFLGPDLESVPHLI
jgi:hypothetical protein